MDESAKTIAVVRNAPGMDVQEMFRALVKQWAPARVAGVIAESHGLPDRACTAGYLRDIGNGEAFQIFHDDGPGSKICHLDGAGALAAADAVQREIAAGCDLVLLSKFGKMEAAGEGLLAAFEAARDAGLPLLTSVSPAFEAAVSRFAASQFTALPADPDRIDGWWQAIRSRS